MREVIENAFRKAKLFTPTSARGQFLEYLRTTAGNAVGRGAAAHFFQRDLDKWSRPVAQGVMYAFAFDNAINSSRAVAELKALSVLKLEWEQAIVELRQQTRQRIDTLDAEIAGAKQNASRAREDFAQQLETQSGAFGTKLKNSSEELDALKRTMEAGLAMQAPVTYWSAKRRLHSSAAGKLQRWMLGYFGVGFFALCFAAAQLLTGESGDVHKLPLWHLAAFTSLVGMFIWGARILVRMMLSHTHLATDAHERSVIANTFLALVRRGKMNDSTVDKVLEALLRHSPDGIVRDGALPYLADMLKKD
jgi:hypothetical protein